MGDADFSSFPQSATLRAASGQSLHHQRRQSATERLDEILEVSTEQWSTRACTCATCAARQALGPADALLR